MRIILSPAKKMNGDTDALPWRDLPAFLPKAQQLLNQLRLMSFEELKRLWKCNDSIARLNVERLSGMDLRGNLKPAILAYEGIQYQYMAADVFTQNEYDYVQEHLRILSGFYGMLRPLDGVTPYRLEMQAKLKTDVHRDLYGFWGDKIYRELAGDGQAVILNLASKEYSRAVEPYLRPGDRFVTCVFGTLKDGKVRVKATEAKMARGEMVRFLAGIRASEPEEARAFEEIGFAFCEERSTDCEYVFLKED